jgi:hypothetical protein
MSKRQARTGGKLLAHLAGWKHVESHASDADATRTYSVRGDMIVLLDEMSSWDYKCAIEWRVDILNEIEDEKEKDGEEGRMRCVTTGKNISPNEAWRCDR